MNRRPTVRRLLKAKEKVLYSLKVPSYEIETLMLTMVQTKKVWQANGEGSQLRLSFGSREREEMYFAVVVEREDSFNLSIPCTVCALLAV